MTHQASNPVRREKALAAVGAALPAAIDRLPCRTVDAVELGRWLDVELARLEDWFGAFITSDSLKASLGR